MSSSRDPALYNEDLAPTPESERTWSRWHIAALWVGMAVCIPTYGLAAALIAGGASLGLAVTAVAIGNLVVLVPLILNGHPGTKYGVPFPVLIRSSFGVTGAHLPTMIRALVACGWFGIQTWIGGKALHFLAVTLAPDAMAGIDATHLFGITLGQLIAFVAFWLVNVLIIVRGIEALKVFETWAAPFLLVTGLALLLWAWYRVGDFGAMVSTPAKTAGEGGMTTFSALAVGITGAVAFWGTLALNIPDFTRYAKNQREQAVGQAISLPTTMTFYVFIGAAVTNATVLIFGERISDPVAVLARAGGPLMVGLAMVGLIIATLSTNLAANVVSPANGFANLAPRHINFRRGALITAFVGLVIMPWKMWEDPNAYVVTWLVGCGGLLGAVGGIMIADYFIVRKTELDIDDLYRFEGRYGGVNLAGVVALVVGLIPLVPGFLGTLRYTVAPPFQPWIPEFLSEIYNWSWFVAFIVAGVTYLLGVVAFGVGAPQAVPAARLRRK